MLRMVGSLVQEDVDAALKLLGDGWSTQEVAKELGVYHSVVLKIVREFGTPEMKKDLEGQDQWSKKSVDPGDVVNLRKRGLTYRQIAAELGVSHERVRQILDEHLSPSELEKWRRPKGTPIKPPDRSRAEQALTLMQLGVPLADIGAALKLSNTRLTRDLTDLLGVEGLAEAKRKYYPTVKLRHDMPDVAYAMWRRGDPIRKIAEVFGVSFATVLRSLKRHREQHPDLWAGYVQGMKPSKRKKSVE